MIDEKYKEAFKEVNEILENTEKVLIDKIPKSFLKFLKENMDNNYQVKLDRSLKISEQNFLQETNDLLSLIYRSYLATEEEKKEFIHKDKKSYEEEEIRKKEEYKGKSIEEIFQKGINIKQVTLNRDLIVLKQENIFEKFIKKIKKFLKINKN